MIWIFPMAGEGSRTRQLGGFKPFIEINGRKMLNWLFISIKTKIEHSDKLVFVTTDEYCEKFHIARKISEILENENLLNSVELITCPDTPPGPSATVYRARETFCNDEPVIVVNCDQYINFNMHDLTQGNCGFLPVYAEFTQKSSYVEIHDGLITKIVEKKNISNLASAGVYAVSSGRALVEAIEKQFSNNQQTNGEFYVGVAFNNLIMQGYKLYPTGVRAKYDLGNVKGVELFEQMLSEFSLENDYVKMAAFTI
jgi:NDP-sugar pyrophosphorylase family protein